MEMFGLKSGDETAVVGSGSWQGQGQGQGKIVILIGIVQ